MSPESTEPKRNRKRPRVDSDPDEVSTSANAQAVTRIISAQGLEETSPSQSSQPSSLHRSQRFLRTEPNPYPTSNDGTSVVNVSQISQPSAVTADPRTQTSRLAPTKSHTQLSPSTSSRTRKKPKRSQEEAVSDRNVDLAELGTSDAKILALVSSTPHSTSTSSTPGPLAAPSHAVLHPSSREAAATGSTDSVDGMADLILPTLNQAREYIGHQPNHTGSDPSVQLYTTKSSIAAGRDFGSGNVSQHGHGNVAFGNSNEVHIHNASPTDGHQALMSRIREKIRPYIADEATLSKGVHGDPSLCYQGTREGLLEHVLSWVEGTSAAETRKNVDDVTSRALCIVGAPGSGKTTIMNTLVLNLLRDAVRRSPGLIAAHYCIRRSLQSTTDSSKVLPTLTLQLARRDPGIAERISTLLDEALHTDVVTPEVQEEVFLEAISAYNQVVFVIIDALDEASQPADLAAMLAHVIHASPPHLRLLLATRNEQGVLQGLGHGLIPDIVHEIPTEESLDEVGAYIVHRLRRGVHKIFGDNPAWRFWPDNCQLRSLSDRAGGLFIWARTAVDYILSRIRRRGLPDRDQWIANVGSLGLADVNSLYLFILTKQLETDENDGYAEDEDVIRVGMTAVLGLIIVAEHPLALDDLVGLLEPSDFDVTHFVSLARSILVPGTVPITGSTIPQMHKTFVDFITSERASAFRIDIDHHHCKAADRCFAVMASKLRFNIAGLHSSFSRHGELDDLATSIPAYLSYASTLWWYHLDTAGADQLPSSHLTRIRAFLEHKLLFWLEIITILGQRGKAQDWIRKLGERLASWQGISENGQLDIVDFTRDALMLMVNFGECIGASIPHIYISLLAFSPRDSIVANHYRKQCATTVIPHPSGMLPRWDSWNADPRRADSGSANSVSFSPCGRRLASGYASNNILLWDVNTGECGIEPLKGHRNWVNTVCFSPSGLLVASGSSDNTIRVWDAETGSCMYAPLKGHTELVWSVSFSPDSTRIVSGSKDGVVRVWDVRTGSCVLGPLKGQSGPVNSVLYSPDGLCIASGYDHAAIRLWNAQTGAGMSGGTLTGHTGPIVSLSFHPGGHRLVSGSWDNSLRVWDIETGTCIHDYLTRHDESVCSVCFSPDGRYIASSSNDCAIRIWDAETAVCIAGPFGGASNWVSSLAFSPDGRYLAAGSWDGAVRLWDFKALLSAGLCDFTCDDQAATQIRLTDHTIVDDDGWTLGPHGESLFWAPKPYNSAIWRPSTVRILGRPSMIQPDLSKLITGEEWLSCFSSPYA